MHSGVIIFIVRSCKETIVKIWQTFPRRQKSCTSVNASNPHIGMSVQWKVLNEHRLYYADLSRNSFIPFLQKRKVCGNAPCSNSCCSDPSKLKDL